MGWCEVESSFFGRGALREEGAIRKPECAIL
jgi:hypothetical protein